MPRIRQVVAFFDDDRPATATNHAFQIHRGTVVRPRCRKSNRDQRSRSRRLLKKTNRKRRRLGWWIAFRLRKVAETPDFSGLQLLLNGIEQVEHVREVGSETSAVVGAVTSVVGNDEDAAFETKPISTQPANGLEILCALADQRFYEETEDGKEEYSKGPSGTPKKRAKQSMHDTSDDDKISSYRYKNDDSPILKSGRLFDSKHNRSVSPYEGNQLKMRLELARLQKKYRETRKVLDRLTHGKYAAAVSSSSTRYFELSASIRAFVFLTGKGEFFLRNMYGVLDRQRL
ncbi:hypothetical protein U1Q18_048661 [Sarracenia purpurea var. burkii]